MSTSKTAFCLLQLLFLLSNRLWQNAYAQPCHLSIEEGSPVVLGKLRGYVNVGITNFMFQEACAEASHVYRMSINSGDGENSTFKCDLADTHREFPYYLFGKDPARIPEDYFAPAELECKEDFCILNMWKKINTRTYKFYVSRAVDSKPASQAVRKYKMARRRRVLPLSTTVNFNGPVFKTPNKRPNRTLYTKDQIPKGAGPIQQFSPGYGSMDFNEPVFKARNKWPNRTLY
eukprot:Lankesteria_metandrocarpae@DN10950_c0_g1_i1.p1